MADGPIQGKIQLYAGDQGPIEIPHTFLPGDVICIPCDTSDPNLEHYRNGWYIVRKREFQVEQDGRVTHCNIYADAR